MYFSCHNHTEYSNFRLRDCINRIPELINYAHELGYKGICITEHETIAPSIKIEEYFNTVKDKDDWNGFKVGIGNEIYLCSEDVCAENRGTDIRFTFPHFILIALDAEGHKQLREISTRAWMRAFMHRNMMRVPTYFRDLEEIIGSNPGHVVGASACLGGNLPQYILSHKGESATTCYPTCETWIDVMNHLFGNGYFFLELQPSRGEDQRYVNSVLIELSKRTHTPYIITTDSHYLKKEDAKFHEMYLKAQDGDREVSEFYESTYVMSEEEIHEYLDENIGYDAVQRGINNTMLIYEKIQSYSLQKPLRIPYMPLDSREPSIEFYKKYVKFIPALKTFYESPEACDRHMVRAITESIELNKSFQNQKMYDHLNVCLETIWESSKKMDVHWSAYLLSVADYVSVVWSKGDSLVGAARGSGCGFGLLNVLGITQINPLEESTPTYYWRFLNPERASVLDIDVDIESNKRESVIKAFQDTYGKDRVSKVLTYSTEGTRSAILTVARGLGIDNDIAAYISSLVISDRGMQRSLKTMYYGDDDNAPVGEFVSAMKDYPELWEGALKIEGLCCGVGSHAGGVVFVDEPFTNTTALMKTNSGDVITQFDLHECEKTSLIKIDLLSIEGLDKIRTCLDLLLADGRISWHGSLKRTYEAVIGIQSLERHAPEMWKLLHEHKVISLFQMEKDSGIQALSLIKPDNIDQLATLNSVIRLMPQDKDAERPLEKYARFRYDINEWYKEMKDAGLSEDEQAVLEKILGASCGVCIYQEQLMMLVMEPLIGGFSLAWADKLRKAVAKKQPKDFIQLEHEFFANAQEKQLSIKLAQYVWHTLISTQRGYGFNSSHCLSYSLIALQELNLCYKYPIIYWDAANLIVDSGSLENSDKTTNYGKMAIAIANMKNNNIKVELPLINEAQRGFVPNVEKNEILFSFKAINGIGDDVVDTILAHRPFKSFEDFCERMVDTKIIKNAAVIALIKAGCFEELDNKDRHLTMWKYVEKYLFEPNTSLTLANMKRIQDMGIVPSDYKTMLRIYNFKNYVLSDAFFEKNIIDTAKRIPKRGYHDRAFVLNNISMPFFMEHFSEDSVLDIKGECYVISEKLFTKEWERLVEPLVSWIRSGDALKCFNQQMFTEVWQKYGSGTESAWDMAALSFYYNEHELRNIAESAYGVVDYFALPTRPRPYEWVKRTIGNKTVNVPKFQIVRLAGTVLNADNNHYTVSLLTTEGVVNIKFNKGQYAFYNRQISAQLKEGSDKKTVLDTSWFKRGTKLLVCGYRQDDNFRAYRYKDTVYTHTVAKIEHIFDDGLLELSMERVKIDDEQCD